MAIDHYKVLGVQPDAEEVVIRAAYLALMRRYHPDQSTGQPTLEKAQEVSSAYAVLSDPERRKAYDERRTRRLVEPPVQPTIMRVRRSSAGRNLALLVAAGTLGLLGFVTTRHPDGRSAAAQASSSSPGYTVIDAGTGSNDCNTRIDAESIRRAVFAEASRLASGDHADLRHAAAASIVRVSDIQADEGSGIGQWRCNATVAVELPPGTVTAGGQRRIIADLLYTIDRTPGSDRQRIAVPPGELIATSLAAVRRNSPAPAPTERPPVVALASAASAAATPPRAEAVRPTLPPAPLSAAAPRTRQAPSPATATVMVASAIPAPRPVPEPHRLASVVGSDVPITPARAQTSPTRPALAASRSVPASSRNPDGDDTVALLTRMSALLYNQSLANADPDKRGRLLRTRASFVARLNNCTSDGCRKAAYLARNGEIVSIMRGEPS